MTAVVSGQLVAANEALGVVWNGQQMPPHTKIELFFTFHMKDFQPKTNTVLSLRALSSFNCDSFLVTPNIAGGCGQNPTVMSLRCKESFTYSLKSKLKGAGRFVFANHPWSNFSPQCCDVYMYPWSLWCHCSVWLEVQPYRMGRTEVKQAWNVSPERKVKTLLFHLVLSSSYIGLISGYIHTLALNLLRPKLKVY